MTDDPHVDPDKLKDPGGKTRQQVRSAERRTRASYPLRRNASGSVGCAMYGAVADVASPRFDNGCAGCQIVKNRTKFLTPPAGDLLA
jgi:hypothetical protein